MKKVLIILLGIVVVLVMAFWGIRSYTKRYSPDATANYSKNGLKIDIKYCQPSKKNRVIFGNIVPYGKVWRTGANEITEVTFNQDVTVGNAKVEAGSYALFSIPTENEWTIILNSGNRTFWGQRSWGTQYDKEKDVTRVKVSANNTDSVTERFTIDIKDGEKQGAVIHLYWDKLKVNIPVKKQ
ncbi:DUF2911 domain-containing protein [uncultured Microscilla sp.]|uniref:DUF2911 domain-containing protein n=1 Tax=uncultured Microscilla sp. TaxID=432653 RepID=UPI0026381921|nr:DUF2911 domain-containing protein [uncultured Microscilla sp.]